jgi:hypothetical protein
MLVVCIADKSQIPIENIWFLPEVRLILRYTTFEDYRTDFSLSLISVLVRIVC